MNLQNLVLSAGLLILLISFSVLASMISHTPLNKFFFEQTGQFAQAFWNLRSLDVFIQVMLIFSASLGVLTFFARRENR